MISWRNKRTLTTTPLKAAESMFFSEESEGWGGSGLKDRGSLLVSYKGRTITFLSRRGGLENFQKKILSQQKLLKNRARETTGKRNGASAVYWSGSVFHFKQILAQAIALHHANLKLRKIFMPQKIAQPSPSPPNHTPQKNKWSIPNRPTSIFDLFSSSSVSPSLDDVSFGVNGDETFSVLLFWFGSGDSSSVEPPYMSSSLIVSFGLSDRKKRKKELALD